jgi:tetratricopeptide (TPR) repeat protein
MIGVLLIALAGKNAGSAAILCGVSLCCALLVSSCSNQPKTVAPLAPKGGEPDLQTLLKILSDQQASLPKNSPKLETALEKVASLYEVQNRYDLAEKYLEQLTQCIDSYGNWERLSLAYAEQQKFDQAIEAIKHSVALIEAKNNSDNIAAVYIRYAKLLEKAGRKDEAAPLRAKAKALAPNIKNSTLRWH